MTIFVKALEKKLTCFKQHEVICELSGLMIALGALRDRS